MNANRKRNIPPAPKIDAPSGHDQPGSDQPEDEVLPSAVERESEEMARTAVEHPAPGRSLPTRR